MSRPSSLRRLRVLLPSLIVAVYLMSPVNQVQAQGCIEYTVYNEQTQRCECPDQWCCDFYWPFVPYGCPIGSEGAAMVDLTRSSPVLQVLQYGPQKEINGAEFQRLEFLSYSKATSFGERFKS